MSEKLKVLKDNAVKAYEAADQTGKKLLQDLFPGELVPIKITDRIKNFNDVLADQKITIAQFNKMIANDTDDEAAYKRMKLISRCLNEGPLDPAKTLYNPMFNRDAGLGFSSTGYGGWITRTDVGARLSFKSSELAIYAGNTFPEIYKPFMLELTQTNQSNV